MSITSREKLNVNSWFIVLPVLAILAAGVAIWQRYHIPITTLSLKGQSLHLLVADTPARQRVGLGNRNSLGRYDGMLFVFESPDRYGIVMRNMRFSIDIVWFHEGRVVDIAPKVPIEPSRAEPELTVYFPRDRANAVIEFPAGWTESHGLRIGDQLGSL